MITLNNYEEYLIDYLQGELSTEYVIEMEIFLKENPSIHEEYLMLQETILVPDETIVYPDKKSLLKPIQISFYHTYKKYFAAAAMIIGIVLSLFIWNEKKSTQAIDIANKNTQIFIEPEMKIPSETITTIDTANKTALTTSPQSNITKSNIAHQHNTNTKKQIVKSQDKEEVQIAHQEKQKESPIETILKEKKDTLEQRKVIVKNIIEENLLPLPDNQSETNDALASNTSKNTIVLDTKHQPRLFKAIAQLVQFSRKVKTKKDELANTELVVMLGNKKIINVNQN